MVEQRIENPRVGGSIPPQATKHFNGLQVLTQGEFRARLRRAAFGWRGTKLPIARIDEGLAEIRAVARRDPAAAGEAAVILLEKRPPALREEDNLVTSAGSAAGLDACLHLIRRDFGASVANTVARRMVVAPHREGGQAQYVEAQVASATCRARFAGAGQASWLSAARVSPFGTG